MNQPLTHPTGTHTIRLADIPLAQRLAALTTASAHAKDEAEAIKMLHLALEPGDTSARVAA